MQAILRLSIRNIWRNRRRTFLTAGSITVAVFFTIIMRSVQTGMWDNMIESVVRYYAGYVQVHSNGYWEDRSINDLMILDDGLEKAVGGLPYTNGMVPRLESFALASVGKSTKGALVAGIDPQRENSFSSLEDKVIEGSYLEDADMAVLISEGLAERLNTSVGDSVILISQGYHGVNAVGMYPVKGIVSFSSPELNNQLIYLPLQEAQYFYGAEGMASSVILNTSQPDNLIASLPEIRKKLGENYEVMDYRQLMPSIVEAEALDVAGAKMMLAILYVIISFGIFGTIVMMMKERQYEFGVLKAIGMKSTHLFAMVWLETMAIGLIGCAVGMALGLAGSMYFHYYPIEMTGEYAKAYEQFGVLPVIISAIDPLLFLKQALTVLLVVSLLSLYPFWKLIIMKPVEAMRA